MNNSRYLVAAGDVATAQAAQEVLRMGGNAFDGAVAAVFTAMVSESTLTSAGGGGCFLASPCDGSAQLFDFFVNMPSRSVVKSDLDFFGILVDFGDAQQEFHCGKAAAAVPGNVAGLLHVQDKLGQLPLTDVLTPAVRAARDGVALSEAQAYLVKILAPILTHSTQGKKLYAPSGRLLSNRDLLVMPEFADFLTVLGREGSSVLYQGAAARIISNWARDGGLLQEADLSDYCVFEREPLRTSFQGYEILLNPPPAQSGVLIDITLSLLERGRPGTDSMISFGDLARAFAVTNQFRGERVPYGPSSKLGIPVSKTSLFDEYLRRFRLGQVGGGASVEPFSRGSTTHVSVLDKDGNGASVTTTNGEGCGYVLPELGFMLNNMLGEEDLNPKGFFKYPANSRLASMMAPTIVRRDGEPVLLTGTAGSNRIRSVIVQLLVNHLCLGMDIEEATSAPRIHLEGQTLHLEPDIDEQELGPLPKNYELECWQRQNLFFGGANSVTRNAGAADPRRGGITLVFS